MALVSSIAEINSIKVMEEITEAIDEVEVQANAMKLELLDSVKCLYNSFQGTVSKVTFWKEDLEKLKGDLVELEENFETCISKFQTATIDLNTLTVDMKRNKDNIIILEALIDTIAHLEAAPSAPNMLMSSNYLKKAEDCLELIQDKFPEIEGRIWLHGIKCSMNDCLLSIYEQGAKEWNSIFAISSSKLIIKGGEDGLRISEINEITNTLLTIDHFQKVWAPFGNTICNIFLPKLASFEYSLNIFVNETIDLFSYSKKLFHSGSVDLNAIKNLISSTNCRKISIEIIKSPVDSVKAVVLELGLFLGVLNVVFSSNTQVMELLGALLGPKLFHILISSQVRKFIFGYDIEMAKKNVDLVQKLLFDIVENLGLNFEGLKHLDFSTKFDAIFAERLKEDLIAELRTLIKGAFKDSVKIDTETEFVQILDEEELDLARTNTYLYPFFFISTTIESVIFMLLEFMRNNSDSEELPSYALDLFLAMLATPKFGISENVSPKSSFLVHNDCMYLAFLATLKFSSCEEQIPLLRAEASKAYRNAIETIKIDVDKIVDSALVLLPNESKSNEFCQKLRDINTEYIKLKELFTNILSPKIAENTLAVLVDHTLHKIIAAAVDLEVISKPRGENLAMYFANFSVEISRLFGHDNRYMPHSKLDKFMSLKVKLWNKFQLLIFLMTASIRNISDKWVDGCGPLAAEFTSAELKKLILALFHQTDCIVKFLASLSDHP